jgi:GT2 family glycosyltransferase
VGGRVYTISDTSWGKAIALAMSSPFGVGDAKFRYSDQGQLVDTVAFGAYRRDVFERIGFFDESLPRNEDDEFNYRLRKAGGKILFSPTMTANYHSRSSLGRLWKQYFGYGRGKVKVARKHATMMRLRHVIPALFVAALVIFAVAALIHRTGLVALALCCGLYLATASFFSFKIALSQQWHYLVRLPVVFFILHISYGCGTIVGVWDMLAQGSTKTLAVSPKG